MVPFTIINNPVVNTLMSAGSEQNELPITWNKPVQRSLKLIRTTEENGASEGDDERVCQSGPKLPEIRRTVQAYSQAVKLDALHEDCEITFLDAYKLQNANKSST